MTAIKKMIIEFWKRHICDDFPKSYPPECFDCKLGTCHGCPLNEKFIK